MQNTKVDEILFGDDGKVTGIRNGDQIAFAPVVITDSTYTTSDKVEESNKVIRAICIMNHPIPETGDAQSAQIILPGK